MRFVQVDRVTEVKFYEHAKGVKCVSLSDDLFSEHFPGVPVYPGSLVIESFAQLTTLLIQASFDDEGKPLRQAMLLMVNRMKLKKPILPGDRIDLTSRIVSRLERSFVAEVTAEVDGEVRASGEVTIGLGEEVEPARQAALNMIFKPIIDGARILR